MPVKKKEGKIREETGNEEKAQKERTKKIKEGNIRICMGEKERKGVGIQK